MMRMVIDIMMMIHELFGFNQNELYSSMSGYAIAVARMTDKVVYNGSYSPVPCRDKM